MDLQSFYRCAVRLFPGFGGFAISLALTAQAALGQSAAIHVANNAALTALKMAPSTAVTRDGFAAAGDGGAATYVYSASACTQADSGAHVTAATGGCWTIQPPTTGVDIRVWGATTGADIVPYMHAAYLANVGVDIVIPQGVWPVLSAVNFNSALVPRFKGVGWAEYDDLGSCPSGGVQGTWLHETRAMTGTTPFTFSTNAIEGNGGISNVAFCQDHPKPSAITASIAGISLTLSGGTLAIGQGIGGAGVKPGTVIMAGGGSRWMVNNAQTVGSEPMTAWAPTVYAPVIALSNMTGEMDFNDDFIFGVYQWMTATGMGGRLDLQHNRGQAFSNFLTIDNYQDTSHGGDTYLWPIWNSDEAVEAWQEQNGNAFIFERVDGITWPDLFASNYRAGIRFLPSGNGITIGANFPGYYCDFCKYSVEDSASNVAAQFGNIYLGGGNIPGSSGVEVDGLAGGSQIQIANYHCTSMGGGCVDMPTSGSSNTVTIGSIWLHDYNQDNNGSYAFAGGHNNFLKIAMAPTIGGSNNSGGAFNTATGAIYEGPFQLPWTPGIGGSTDMGSAKYKLTNGWYVANGKLVTVSWQFNLATFGGATGSAEIVGLPYKSSTGFVNPGRCTITLYDGITFDPGYTSLSAGVASNSDVALLYESGASASPQTKNLPISAIGATAVVGGSCDYQTP